MTTQPSANPQGLTAFENGVILTPEEAAFMEFSANVKHDVDPAAYREGAQVGEGFAAHGENGHASEGWAGCGEGHSADKPQGATAKVRQDFANSTRAVWEADEGKFVSYGSRFAVGYARAEMTVDEANGTMKMDVNTYFCIPEGKRKDIKRLLARTNNNLIIEGMNITDEGVVHFTTADLPVNSADADIVLAKAFSTVARRMPFVTEAVAGANAKDVYHRMMDLDRF